MTAAASNVITNVVPALDVREPPSVWSIEAITDDRGNRPTKSLWIGNVPSSTSGSAIWEIFGKFGTIESVSPTGPTRVSMGFAFVNFKDLESSVAAWRALHDQDIFRVRSPVYVRFTSGQSEQKPLRQGQGSGDAMSLSGLKAAQAKSEWFRPIEGSRQPWATQQDGHPVWARGGPPTAPRSMRADSYRPIDRWPQGDSYRQLTRRDSHDQPLERRSSDTWRPVGADLVERHDRRPQQASYCPINDETHQPPVHVRFANRTSDRYASKPLGEEGVLPRLPESAVQHQREVGASGGEDHRKLPDRREQESYLEDQRGPPGLIHEQKQKAVDGKSSQQTNAPSAAQASDGKVCSPEYMTPPPTIDLRIDAEDDPDPNGSSVGPEVANRDSVNPGPFGSIVSSNAIKRLRTPNDDSSSQKSEVTSSSNTSAKGKRCTDCKCLGSDLSPLFSCTRCPRRFHSCCGNPQPSLL